MLIRPAHPGDELAIAHVHVRTWQAAYRGLMPDAYLDSLRAEVRAARYDLTNTDPQKPFTLVAVDNEQILGFASTMPARDNDVAGSGELCALYVDPPSWGKRIGVALVGAARTHLVDSGFDQAILWVLAGNARAERFYRSDGWQPDGIQRSETIWEVTVEESRLSRSL